MTILRYKISSKKINIAIVGLGYVGLPLLKALSKKGFKTFGIDTDKKKINGIANLGFRPTFNQNKILLEVNLFNFNRNLYNKKLVVEFIKFIRREKKFKSIKQLTNQIKKDIRVAKNILK